MCNFARYAFGDSRKPSTDSASLIEEIVHSQMASMVFVFIMATFPLGTGDSLLFNCSPLRGMLVTVV